MRQLNVYLISLSWDIFIVAKVKGEEYASRDFTSIYIFHLIYHFNSILFVQCALSANLCTQHQSSFLYTKKSKYTQKKLNDEEERNPKKRRFFFLSNKNHVTKKGQKLKMKKKMKSLLLWKFFFGRCLHWWAKKC